MAKGIRSKKDKKARRSTGNAPSEDENDVTKEDNEALDPEDLEYFQDSQRSFAFLQNITAE